ncbi:hypothetical protein J3R82DRAFT_6766 [Butyriboletus roseoflavus]|nr:hypothetical protein J3R82DRAFT_6766 [Butyriboletus roseoflavus]
MNFNALPTISFTPTSDSSPFESKQLALSDKVRVQLESQSSHAPSSSNGIFPRGPLSLSTPHAEVWIQGKQVLIRDRSSAYGTYVNSIRIQNQTLLQDGDIVVRDRVIVIFFVLISTCRRWDNAYFVHQLLQTHWISNSAPSRHPFPSLVCEVVGTEDTAISYTRAASSLCTPSSPGFPSGSLSLIITSSPVSVFDTAPL